MRVSGRSGCPVLVCVGFPLFLMVAQRPDTDPVTTISDISIGNRTLAIDATTEAILGGVRAATGLPTHPSFGDLQGGVR